MSNNNLILSFLDHGDIFTKEPFSKREAWEWLIKNSYQHNKQGKIDVSFRFLAQQWKWHKSKVERFLKTLRTETLIETETGTDFTVIKVNEINRYKLSELFNRDKIETAVETPLKINLINSEEASSKTTPARQNGDSLMQTSEIAQARAEPEVEIALETAIGVNPEQTQDSLGFKNSQEKEKQEKKKRSKKRKEKKEKEKEKTPLKGGKKEKFFEEILDQDFDEFDEAELYGEFEELKSFRKLRELKNSSFELLESQVDQAYSINSVKAITSSKPITWDSFIDQSIQSQVQTNQLKQTDQTRNTNPVRKIDRIIDDIDQLEVSDIANWAEANLPMEIELEWELEKFKDHLRANLKKQPQNLVAAFRNWLRKALEFKRLRDNQDEKYSSKRANNLASSNSLTRSRGYTSFEKFLSGGMKVIDEFSKNKLKQTDEEMLINGIDTDN